MENQDDQQRAAALEQEDTTMPVGAEGTPTIPTTPSPMSGISTPQGEAIPPFSNPEPKRRKRGPAMIIVAIFALIVGAGVGIALYKMYVEPKSTNSTTTTTSSTATSTQPTADAVALAQHNKVIDVIAHVRQLITTEGLSLNDTSSIPPHRKLGSPYNFYAAGTAESMWTATSSKITGVSRASEFAKTVYNYLTTTAGATSETLIGDASLALTTDGNVNYLRLSTDSYTCGLTEEATLMAASPYTADGGTITLSCSTLSEYERNAAIQQPFYKAILTNATYSADKTMLSMPQVSESPTANYLTANVTVGSDTALVGSAAGLFYRVPDGTWRFFQATQAVLDCGDYNTTDLKKAYVGTSCYATNSSTESKVSL